MFVSMGFLKSTKFSFNESAVKLLADVTDNWANVAKFILHQPIRGMKDYH